MQLPEPDPADVASLDALVATLYEAISFGPNAVPDWDRFASLFHPRGRLIPPHRDENGELAVLGVGDFVRRSTEYAEESGLRERGFHEREIGRRTERFGRIAHLFSAYASYRGTDDSEPFSRGINSIQAVWERERWWVLTVLWDAERPDVPIPQDLGG